MRALIVVLGLMSAPAWAQVTVENPWARATPPGAKIAAGYMTIRNASATPDRLVAVSSPAAALVQTHVTVKDGDMLRMREVKGYAIPANGSFELKPGGPHLMFVNIKAPFKEGDRIPAVLKFERSGEIKTEFHVGAVGATGADQGADHHGH